MFEQLPGWLGRIGLLMGMIALWAAALVSVYRRVLVAQQATHHLFRALHDLAEWPARLDRGLRAGMRRLLFRPRGPLLPAEVRKDLEAVMLAPENALAEEGGVRIVPNEYVVELNPGTFQRHYQPGEKQLTEQWRRWLVGMLDTANNRVGDRRYRFWGPVHVEIRPADDLAANQVRVQGRINAGVGGYQPAPAPAGAAVPAPGAAPAAGPPAAGQAWSGPATALMAASAAGCLEMLPNGRRWPLRPGLVVLGRSETAQVRLDSPEVQKRRLISGQHAYIRVEQGRCLLFDGTPEGRPSINGTFVNGRRVPAGGHALRDGDVIVLAAPDPDNPRPDLPGVAGLIFYDACS